MRKGCLIAVLALAALAGLLLYSNRSLEIERGFKLNSYVSGAFTFDAWSYGNWIESEQFCLHVSTYEPPYTLVLAIRPADPKVESIEVLNVFTIDKSGNKASVLDRIKQPIVEVKSSHDAIIKSPYAALIIDKVLESNAPVTLEIEFRTNPSNGSEAIRQTLEIKSFEKKSRSFVFWDIMSSV